MFYVLHVLVIAWPQLLLCKISKRHAAKMPLKHEAVPRAFIVRQCTECFILCIARVRPCFSYFKELTHECLVKDNPFQRITRPSTLSSWARQFRMI